MLIGGRAIAGLGAAGLMNGGLNIIGVSVPAQKRPCELLGSFDMLVEHREANYF